MTAWIAARIGTKTVPWNPSRGKSRTTRKTRAPEIREERASTPNLGEARSKSDTHPVIKQPHKAAESCLFSIDRAMGAKKGFQRAREEGKSQTKNIDAAQEKTILRLANRERDRLRCGRPASDGSIFKS